MTTPSLDVPLEHLWEGLAKLRTALKVPQLAQLGKVWDVQIDSEFRIFVNGAKHPEKYISPMGGSESILPPYECHVFFTNALAGTFNPFGGQFIYRPNDIARRFLDAIDAKVKEVSVQ